MAHAHPQGGNHKKDSYAFAVQQLKFVCKAAAQSQPDRVHSRKAEATNNSHEKRF